MIPPGNAKPPVGPPAASSGSSRHRYFCPFCGLPLEDEGEAFMRHVEETPRCQQMWESWLELMRGGDAGGD
ncbi:MAG TPA: hypothetical protein VI893_02000 [Thermoplasmata archaeon]|nr:hypothetical protein [Thermoplasmata archaeon]